MPLAIITNTFHGKLLVETFTRVKNSNLDDLNNIEYVEDEGIIYKYEKKIQNFL